MRRFIILFMCLWSLDCLMAARPACNMSLVETYPDGMQLFKVDGPVGTDVSLIELIDSAHTSIHISTPFIALTPFTSREQSSKASIKGKKVLDALFRAINRGVYLSIVVDKNMQRAFGSYNDESWLSRSSRWTSLDTSSFTNLRKMHSKFVLVDNESFYLGSAKLDWKSFSQTKEFGVTIWRCRSLAMDIRNLSDYYLSMARTESDQLPARKPTSTGLINPLLVKINDELTYYRAHLSNTLNDKNSSSSNELESLLNVIENAQSFIFVSMTNYNPIGGGENGTPKRYWPVLENALKRAVVERGVKVRLLFSDWKNFDENQSQKALFEESQIYRSLNQLKPRQSRGSMEINLYNVPTDGEFRLTLLNSRTKHDKYVLTDRALYVGTSNWTEDDFKSDANIGLVLERGGRYASSIFQIMRHVFERDFYSSNARAA